MGKTHILERLDQRKEGKILGIVAEVEIRCLLGKLGKLSFDAIIYIGLIVHLPRDKSAELGVTYRHNLVWNSETHMRCQQLAIQYLFRTGAS